MATCKSCGEEIVWLTLESRTTAKPNPINVATSYHGNIEVDIPKGTYRLVEPGPGKHLSHFVTCPERLQWKAKKV